MNDEIIRLTDADYVSIVDLLGKAKCKSPQWTNTFEGIVTVKLRGIRYSVDGRMCEGCRGWVAIYPKTARRLWLVGRGENQNGNT